MTQYKQDISGWTLALVAIGYLAAGLGLVVLVGWHSHRTALIQILPTFVPMQYNTALGFFLSGTGVAVIAAGTHHRAPLLGLAAGLIGFSTLTEYVLAVDLGVDELLMSHYVTVATSRPGRMASNTALCFS